MDAGLATPTIVLVHGLALTRDASRMFTGVDEALGRAGFRVARTQVQGDGTLDELSERVWRQLEVLEPPLVLLCHSMGGLIARTFLLDEQRARRLRAVATVGSPHAGTPLARFASGFGRAYRELTPAARRAWLGRHGAQEASVAEAIGIRRLSAVASLSGPAPSVHLRPAQALLSRLGQPNDGLVPASSQRWGDHAFDIDADHLRSVAYGAPSEEANEIWLRLARLSLAGAERTVAG